MTKKENNLEFEQSIQELEKKIEELRSFTSDKNVNLKDEIQQLEQKADQMRKNIYKNLSAWQIVQISRHPQRPHALDYIKGLFDNFLELHGDRAFSDDQAMLGGIAWLNKKPIMIIGTQKGKDTKENIKHNFGLPLPEGYRKALRLMKLAEKFNMPIITMIDTAGAFPGVEGEERGVAEAIAHNLREMSILKVPIIVTVIGEGGSGGALGIGVGDSVIMLANASYTVITPEGCAAILWKDRNLAARASEILKLTAPELKSMGIIDHIVPEPEGGAHVDPAKMLESLKLVLVKELSELQNLSKDQLLKQRYNKYRNIGFFHSQNTKNKKTSGRSKKKISKTTKIKKMSKGVK